MFSTDFTDAAGQTHTAARPDARILSLVPSLTELLFDMDLADQLVGRTAFCVHPRPAIMSVPSVGGTKRINMDKVAALAPTHALVNIDETPKQIADALAARGIVVIVTHPIEVGDNRHLFNMLGALFDRRRQADQLIARFDAAFDAARAHLDANAPPRAALYLIWQDPWMTISRDTYISRFLALAGWQTAAHDPAIRYPQVCLENQLLTEVDDVLFSTEPFAFTQHHLSSFRTAFPDHAHKARLINAEMVSWYGSRAIAGLAYLKDFAAEVRRR